MSSTTAVARPQDVVPPDIGPSHVEAHAKGFTALPIIPPGVEISESSVLYARGGTNQDGRGKTPGIKYRDGTWGSFDWVRHVTDEHDLERWSKMGAGTGIRCGYDEATDTTLVAIDADTMNLDYARLIRKQVEERFGLLPVRVGRDPKALYLLRVEGRFTYRRIEFGKERVEILSDSKQFVARGIHNVTGRPYVWHRSLLPFADLKVVEEADLVALLNALRPLLPEAAIKEEGGGEEVSQASLSASVEAITAAVRAIPNTSEHFSAREDYLAVGYAIKAALPNDQEEAFELFQEWCDRWQDGENDPAIVAADWKRMKPPFRRGAKYLFDLAEKLGGFNRGQVFFEPIEDDPFELAALKAANDDRPPLSIDYASMGDWSGRLPELRQWLLNGFIPLGEVTLIYGDGGVGKSLLAQQLATCVAAGKTFLNIAPARANVLAVFCEDSADELHRRQTDINAATGATYEELRHTLKIALRKNEDNALAHWDRQSGKMTLSPLWFRIRDDAKAFGSKLIIIDTIADVFTGSEIDRVQVNAFVKGVLGKLGKETGSTVIALGHPSKDGKSSGDGSSGSTAWNNAVRSRLYLRMPAGVRRSNLRELEGMKSNYGAKGNLLKIRWAHGAFGLVSASVQDVELVPDGQPMRQHKTAEEAVEAAIADAVQAASGEAVSMNMKRNSPYFGPKVVKAREPELFEAYSKAEIEEGFQRLLRRGALIEAEVGRDTSRRPIMGFVVVQDKLSDAAPEDEGKGGNVEASK